MFKPYRIVHDVHEQFRGLPDKLSGITGKSSDWHRSHGYEPKTENPLAYGNVSDAAKFVMMCRRYESAAEGAGRLLSDRIHRALTIEFADGDLGAVDQCDLEVDVINQSCDVQTWLARFDIDDADRASLITFEDECDQAIDAVMRAKARARARRRRIEASAPHRVSRARVG